MFKISTKISSNGNTTDKYLQVKNQKYLKEHLAKIGIDLPRVNFFSYNALPDRSYGIFIVSEEEWLGVMPSHKGDIKFDLTIYDEFKSKSFKELNVASTAFFASPLEAGPARDGNRLILLELELTRNIYTSENIEKARFTYFQAIKDSFENGNSFLEDPDIYDDNWHSNDYSLIDILAYVADVNFLTAYIDPENPDLLIKLTDQSFELNSLHDESKLIYSNVVVSTDKPEFRIIMRSTYPCTVTGNDDGSYYFSDPKEITFSAPELYESQVNSGGVFPEACSFQIAYSTLDNWKIETIQDHAIDFLNDFADAIEPNARTRFNYFFDLIYHGVIDVNICNNIQHIDYEFEEFGLVTKLKSKQWSPNKKLLVPKNLPCQEKLFEATLVKHWNNVNVGAPAIISTLKGLASSSPPVLIDPEAYVTASLDLFENYRAGTKLIVYRPCPILACSYIVIQGPCPPTSLPPAVGPTGACTVQLDNNTSYCYEISEAECDLIGGSWAEGDCNPTPPPPPPAPIS